MYALLLEIESMVIILMPQNMLPRRENVRLLFVDNNNSCCYRYTGDYHAITQNKQSSLGRPRTHEHIRLQKNPRCTLCRIYCRAFFAKKPRNSAAISTFFDFESRQYLWQIITILVLLMSY